MANTPRDWLRQAQADLKAAEDNLTSRNFHTSVFSAQQTIEKGLKALILKRNGRLPKTHNLFILSRDIGAPKEIIERCAKVNPVYEESRYPDVSPDIPAEYFDEEKAKKFLGLAKEVFKWIKAQLD